MDYNQKMAIDDMLESLDKDQEAAGEAGSDDYPQLFEAWQSLNMLIEEHEQMEDALKVLRKGLGEV